MSPVRRGRPTHSASVRCFPKTCNPSPAHPSVCVDAILLRCWGSVNSGVGVAGLWCRPSPSMIASDVSVIKFIIKRVRFDLYRARYDRLRIPSVCDASCVRAHGPDQDVRCRPRSQPWSGVGVVLMAGLGEGWDELGRKGSGWAQFGPRGSREVAFGRAWA